MSGLGTAALIVLTVWLGVLTLVCVLLVRQLGLVTVRLDRSSAQSAPVADGLDVGAAVPKVVSAILPDDGRKTCLLVMGTVCGPCRDLASDLHEPPAGSPIIALVSGREELAVSLADLLPPGIEIVPDPTAAEVVEGLAVEMTPFAFEVEHGRVIGKAALRGADHLLSFLEAGNGAAPHRRSATKLEVTSHGA